MNILDVLKKVVEEFNLDIDLVQEITAFDFKCTRSGIPMIIKGCKVATLDTVIIYFIDVPTGYIFRNKTTKDMVNVLYADAWKQIEISRMLGISQATVSNILNEKD